MVDGLRQYRSSADEAVDHVARRLAGTESGHPGALRDVAVGGGEMAVDLVGRNLDLEDHLRARLRSRRYGDQVSSSVAVVGEARFELARLATPAPKAGASAVPPLARLLWCGGSALSLPMHRSDRCRAALRGSLAGSIRHMPRPRAHVPTEHSAWTSAASVGISRTNWASGCRGTLGSAPGSAHLSANAPISVRCPNAGRVIPRGGARGSARPSVLRL